MARRHAKALPILIEIATQSPWKLLEPERGFRAQSATALAEEQ
jgi:hypothetical protein